MGWTTPPATRRLANRSIAQGIDVLAMMLLKAEGPLHQPAVQALRRCTPAVFRLVSQRLIPHLVGANETGRRRAAACLVDLGPQALPALLDEFETTQSSAVQFRVVRLLKAIVPRLNAEQRFDLTTALIGLGRVAHDEDVILALAALHAAMRTADDTEP